MINRTLKKLWLGGNNIGAVGMKYLCDGLCGNTSVTHLNIASNNIGDEGAKHVSTVLSINSTLLFLNLGNNKIGDEGAKYLSDALVDNITLVEIFLHFNNIGDDGAKRLHHAFSINTTLTNFSIDFNHDVPTSVVYSLNNMKRNGPIREFHPHRDFNININTKFADSVVCSSLSDEQLQNVVDNVDKSTITQFIVDDIHLKNGIVPSWVMKMPKLRSLRFT